MVPIPVPVPVDGDNGDANGSSTQLAFLFGGCHGDGTRVAENEAFALDLSGGGGDAAGGRGDGDADETAGEDGLDGEDAQVGLNKPTNRPRLRRPMNVRAHAAVGLSSCSSCCFGAPI